MALALVVAPTLQMALAVSAALALLTAMAGRRGQHSHHVLLRRLPAARWRWATGAPSPGRALPVDLGPSPVAEKAAMAMMGLAGTEELGTGGAGAGRLSRLPSWRPSRGGRRTGRRSGPLETLMGFDTDSGGIFAST